MFLLVLFSCFQNQETCFVNLYCSGKLNIEKKIIFHHVLSNLSINVFIYFCLQRLKIKTCILYSSRVYVFVGIQIKVSSMVNYVLSCECLDFS